VIGMLGRSARNEFHGIQVSNFAVLPPVHHRCLESTS